MRANLSRHFRGSCALSALIVPAVGLAQAVSLAPAEVDAALGRCEAYAAPVRAQLHSENWRAVRNAVHIANGRPQTVADIDAQIAKTRASTDSRPLQRQLDQLGICLLQQKRAIAIARQRVASSADRPPPTSSAPGAGGRFTEMQVPDASDCLIHRRAGAAGGMVNRCPYALIYTMCIADPPEGSWATSLRCRPGQATGNIANAPASQVPPGSKSETPRYAIYWFACRYDRTKGPQFFDIDSRVAAVFELGKGIRGRCVSSVRPS